MKLNKSLIGVFTFSAVILGAITTSQTVKADDVSDTAQPTTVDTNTTVQPSSLTNVGTDGSNLDQSVQTVDQPSTATSDTASDSAYQGTDAAQSSQTSNNIYDALPDSTTTTTTNTQTNTQTTQTEQTNNTYTNSNTVTTPAQTTNTNGGDWNGDVIYSRPQDNFYMYENGQWVYETTVNDATPEQGTFTTVTANTNQEVEKAFNNLSDGMDSAGTAMDEATWFYQLTQNDDLSNVGVITPDLANEVNSILNMKNINDVNSAFTNMIGRDQPTPFSIYVARDQADPTKNALYFFGAQPLMLTDQGIGANEENAVVDFLQLAGYSDDMIQNIITGTVNYDQLLMNTETADDLSASSGLSGNYAQVNFQDLADLSNYINFNGITQTLTRETPSYVYEMTPSYFNNISQLLNPSTFNDLKGWLISDLILYRASEIQNITEGFQDYLQTTYPMLSQEYLNNPDYLSPQLQKEFAYYLTATGFTDAFSQYYGPQIITPQVEQAATTMVKKIIYTYSTQIINSNWLDNSTKRNALGKLSRLQVKVGYPSSKDFDYFNRVDIEGNNSFYVNYRNIIGSQALQTFADYNDPVNRDAWDEGDSALVPDASYDRLTNSITINAGILQSPFFSVDNTDSQNLGGLGVIIGHELTHAFDANGSLYDGNGEFENWWSDEDRARFNDMVDEMAAEYNGIPYAGGTVNGVQTEDENIADNGGLNVALATLKSEGNYDLDQFFTSYALGWRSKYDDELQQDQLEDVHTPDSIRVNTSLQNIGDFYSTYNVQPGDGMYLAPNKRVNIW